MSTGQGDSVPYSLSVSQRVSKSANQSIRWFKFHKANDSFYVKAVLKYGHSSSILLLNCSDKYFVLRNYRLGRGTDNEVLQTSHLSSVEVFLVFFNPSCLNSNSQTRNTVCVCGGGWGAQTMRVLGCRNVPKCTSNSFLRLIHKTLTLIHSTCL